MPIGPLEIVILLVIILLIFGASRFPQLGRSAGKGVNEIRGSVKEMVGDKADPATLGRKAGEGVREFRELKSAFKDEAEPSPKAQSAEPNAEPAPKAEPAPRAEVPEARSETEADPEQRA